MKIQFSLPVVALTVGLLAALTSIPAKAGGIEPFESINAKAYIDKCWSLSKEDRDSGVTGRMRSGTMKTVHCMHDVIVEQASEMFEPDVLSPQEVKDKLLKIIKAYGSLYWAIYNSHKRCDRFCGTDKHVYHLSAYTSLLEKIIRDMINERNEVRF